jgi:LPS-assembly protein
MKYSNKGKAKNIFTWWCLPLLLLLTYHFNSFAKFAHNDYVFSHNIVDTPPPQIKIDTNKIVPIKKSDSLRVPSMSEEKKKVVLEDSNFIQTADTFAFKKSKDSLSSPVVYHADDSMIIDVPNEKMYLYGKVSSVKYEENNLTAPQIQFDQKTSIVSAFLKKDSTGKVISYPLFTQNDVISVMDTVRFDMKTGKGITKGTYTKQGEMFVYGEKIKKADTSVFYAFRTRFTTCNLDTPHFAFIAKKAKFINKKWAYTGPVHPEFEGVPLPISLPFGIFPLKQGRRSGLLAPTFTADEQRGLALENLGYYRIINQTWDVIARGTIYSYGSWNLKLNPRYFKRYHYQGSFQLDFQNFHPLDQPKQLSYNVDWNHTADSKARPGVAFTAGVHLQSSIYNKQLVNNANQNFNNQLGSSITFSKDWSKKNKPYNIVVSATHNQNNVTKLYNVNLPDIAFSISTQYPFRKKESVGDIKWYENIGIGYVGNTRSSTSFYDTAVAVGKQMLKNLQYGAQHNIPITLSLPPLGALQLSPSVTYSENWAQNKIKKQFNRSTNKYDTVSLTSGLYTARQMTFGLSASTRIFGVFGFKQKSRVKAIRHEMTPSLSINYSPNFNARNYYDAKIDALGNTRPTSYYEGSLYGAFSNQKFGGMSFDLRNTLAMKIRNKGDTSAKADRKVSILDGLSIGASYNFLADSIKLSNIPISANTNLFEKFNLSASANFEPYESGEKGQPINKLILGNKFSIGRLTSANVSLQTSFKGGDKSKKTKNVPITNNANQDFGTQDDFQRDAAYIRNNPAEFADFEIPWELSFSYSLVLSKSFEQQISAFKSTLTQGLTFNVSANLTPKWKIGGNGSYDITNKKLAFFTMFLSRDLHCWQMSINITPVGLSRSFSISISPKSPILRDLKVNRTRTFSDF